MSLTITRPAPVAAPPAPLTDAQQDSLLLLAASTEKPNRVKRHNRYTEQPGVNRAWSASGQID